MNFICTCGFFFVILHAKLKIKQERYEKEFIVLHEFSTRRA